MIGLMTDILFSKNFGSLKHEIAIAKNGAINKKDKEYYHEPTNRIQDNNDIMEA